MKIILDTNMFCEDFHLRGTNFRIFFDGLKLIPGSISIPEVVIDEVVNRYSEELSEIASKESEILAAGSRLIVNSRSLRPQILKHGATIDEFRNFIMEYIKKYGEILPYPEISHKQVVDRDLRRKKPFKRNGSGYRDLLIWESVKTKLNRGTEQVVFLTNNVKDFGDGPLVDPELQKEFYNPNRFKLVKSLREFNEAYIMPRLKMIDCFKTESIQGESIKFDIASWIKNDFLDIIRYEDSLGDVVAGLPYGVGSVRPNELHSLQSIKVIDAHRLESDEVLLKVCIKTEIEFSVDIDWDDYMNHPEARDWAGEADEPFSCSWSYHNASFTAVLDLILSKDTSTLESHELGSIESDYGSIDFC